MATGVAWTNKRCNTLRKDKKRKKNRGGGGGEGAVTAL